MSGGVSSNVPQGYTVDPQGRLQKQTSGNTFSDPATGSPNANPLVGVDPSQMYDTASKSALSKQNFEQSQQAQKNTLGMIPGLMGSMGGSGGTGNVQYPGGVTPQQSQAAVEAEFARAKDTSGQIAKSALTGLSDNMSARGMAGSGAQGEEAAKIINHQAGGLADLNREQAIQGLQYTQHANDTQYQGDIAQRAQNMGLTQSLLGLLRNGTAY